MKNLAEEIIQEIIKENWVAYVTRAMALYKIKLKLVGILQ